MGRETQQNKQITQCSEFTIIFSIQVSGGVWCVVWCVCFYNPTDILALKIQHKSDKKKDRPWMNVLLSRPASSRLAKNHNMFNHQMYLTSLSRCYNGRKGLRNLSLCMRPANVQVYLVLQRIVPRNINGLVSSQFMSVTHIKEVTGSHSIVEQSLSSYVFEYRNKTYTKTGKIVPIPALFVVLMSLIIKNIAPSYDLLEFYELIFPNINQSNNFNLFSNPDECVAQWSDKSDSSEFSEVEDSEHDYIGRIISKNIRLYKIRRTSASPVPGYKWKITHSSLTYIDKCLMTKNCFGAGESGKSTLVKQMKIIHNDGFTEDELRSFRPTVLDNLLSSMKFVLIGMGQLKINLESIKNKYHAQTILCCQCCCDKHMIMLPNIATALQSLWNDKGVRLAMARGYEYELNDSALYLFENMNRLSSEKYTPSPTDVLRARVRTTGIIETHFKINDFIFRMYDVGGQRSERRKWIQCFDDVRALLFVVALSGYDMVLAEDSKVNRLKESLQLYSSICNNRFFQDTAMVFVDWSHIKSNLWYYSHDVKIVNNNTDDTELVFNMEYWLSVGVTNVLHFSKLNIAVSFPHM
ncbi:Guanine nucleotide-binding protein G(o) subunit alpha [Nymphon striatum]|nr:Guanine nucleotide-binding protein G(o) subunit alpha [Nymphon striatum]